MDRTNSPLTQPSASKKAALEYFKTLILQVVQRTRGFIEAKTLPYLATKACEVYFNEADAAHQVKCRHILRSRIEIDPTQLRHFVHTSLGHDLLVWLKHFFHLSNSRGDDYQFKDLLLEMAASPEGLSFLSFLRHSPNAIQPNIDQLLLAAKQIEWVLRSTQAAVVAIRELSTTESHNDSENEWLNLPDFRQPGAFAVRQYSLTLEPSSTFEKQSETDSEAVYLAQQQVVCYEPYPLPDGVIPVIIQSHGLASSPEDMAEYAKHLASYGYFVAAPQHHGSDVKQVYNMLVGKSQEVFRLAEFVDRPLEISILLDELERRNCSEFDGRLKLDEVGVMGYSFGAYTALALAGATINFATLEDACNLTMRNPNLSLLLQCQALGLPRQVYHLNDARIGAIICIDSVGSEVFGAQGIGNIRVPVLLVAGSEDATTPLTYEQIRIFQWLTSSHSYLALMQGRTHIQDMQRLVQNLNLHLKISPQHSSEAVVPPFKDYIKALSLTFFNQHLTPIIASAPCLSANYAAYLSQSPFDLWLISQQSNQSLKQRLQTNQSLIIEEMENG